MNECSARPRRRPSQTKIVATVGPACDEPQKLVELLDAGVDVFRVNTAHGDRQEHGRLVERIREAGRTAGQVVAILVDLAGPKIRLGELPGGQVECPTGGEVRFVRGDVPKRPEDLTTTYEGLIDELQVGDSVMLADGTVALTVEQRDEGSATCRIVQGGLLRSRQGINLPGVRLSVPTLGPEDRDAATWAARTGVEFIGLSFVRSADDVRQLQSLIRSEGSQAHVIAKIEKPEALEDLDQIVHEADGVMVARGDLGVEIDIARVPVVQKEIIDACHRHRKPVIIATQMLDSMQHSRLPTRAEASDVANAILDGADACMLSGETAIGRHPREAVEMMHRIALATEPVNRGRQWHPVLQRTGDRPPNGLAAEEVNQITEATTFAAGRLAEELRAATIVVASASGATALSLSKNRHFVPTIGVSDSEATLRKMCLYWGVIPLPGAPTEESAALLEYVVQRGCDAGYLAQGDRVVLVAGTGLRTTRHNMIVVHELE
jgi:pyruvate kinase